MLSSASAGRPALGNLSRHPLTCVLLPCWSCGHSPLPSLSIRCSARKREFYVAHRVGLIDLLLFMATVSLLLPVALALLRTAVGRPDPESLRTCRLALLGLLTAVYRLGGSQQERHPAAAPPSALTLVGAAGAWLYVSSLWRERS